MIFLKFFIWESFAVVIMFICWCYALLYTLYGATFAFSLKQKLIIKRSPKAGSDGDTEFKAISSVESQTMSNASSPTVDETGSRSEDAASRSQFDDEDEFFVSTNNSSLPEFMDTDDSCNFCI